MPRFNIALVPVDKILRADLQIIAQSYFGETQEGYVLSGSALPHVTLCQFRANDQAAALDAFRSFGARENQTIYLKEFNLRKGTAPHLGFFWAEFPVENAPGLMELQRDCYDHLSARKMEILTSVNAYTPHLTLARLPRPPDQAPSRQQIFLHRPLTFALALSVSSENGVFIREL